MAKIEMSTQEMRARISEIRNESRLYHSECNELFQEGRELDAMWEGDASDSFTSRMKNDEPRFNELYHIINQYCDAVEESANDYDRTEAVVSEEMRGNQRRQSS